MTTRLYPAFLALVLLAAPASYAASGGPLDGGSALDRMGSTDGVLGSSSKSKDATEFAGPGAPPPPPDAPAVPVDGGLTLLALAGAGYATRKLRTRA